MTESRTWEEVDRDIAHFLYRVSFSDDGYGVTGQYAIAKAVGLTQSVICKRMPYVHILIPELWPGHVLDRSRATRYGAVYKITKTVSIGCINQWDDEWGCISTKMNRMSIQANAEDNGPIVKSLAQMWQRDSENAKAYQDILKTVRETL